MGSYNTAFNTALIIFSGLPTNCSAQIFYLSSKMGSYNTAFNTALYIFGIADLKLCFTFNFVTAQSEINYEFIFFFWTTVQDLCS